MRVIAGSLGGRIFEAPRGHRTHPMSEKMRGAIFGSLGDIEGLSVFDPFTGSGALAIEAISRGAAEVLAIEVEPGAYAVASRNIEQFNIQNRVKITKAYAGAWSTRHQGKKFDIVLLDPPYDKIPWRDLKRMPRHLMEDGVLVLSWPGNFEPLHFEDSDLEIIQSKSYGDSQLIFYRHASV